MVTDCQSEEVEKGCLGVESEMPTQDTPFLVREARPGIRNWASREYNVRFVLEPCLNKLPAHWDLSRVLQC